MAPLAASPEAAAGEGSALLGKPLGPPESLWGPGGGQGWDQGLGWGWALPHLSPAPLQLLTVP